MTFRVYLQIKYQVGRSWQIYDCSYLPSQCIETALAPQGRIPITNLCTTTNPFYKYQQWQIQDFPEGEVPIPKAGLLTYYFANCFAENCIKMKEIGPKGVTSLVPPWIRQWSNFHICKQKKLTRGGLDGLENQPKMTVIDDTDDVPRYFEYNPFSYQKRCFCPHILHIINAHLWQVNAQLNLKSQASKIWQQ